MNKALHITEDQGNKFPGKSTNDTHPTENTKAPLISKGALPQISFFSQSSPKNPSMSSVQHQFLPVGMKASPKSSTVQKSPRTSFLSGQFASINKKMLIMNYVYDNSIDQLRKMKAKCFDLNFFEPFKHVSLQDSVSPLILACHLGKLEVMKYILTSPSIQIDLCTEKNGYSALSVACMGGYYELAEYLIKKGADLNIKDLAGHTPLFYCFSRMNEDGNLFENKRLCFKLADLLLQNGANIDESVVEKKGHTLLMHFCRVKKQLTAREKDLNFSCIKYFLEKGADVCKISNQGKTIYELLSNHPNAEAISELIKSTLSKRLTRSRDDSLVKQNTNQKSTQATIYSSKSVLENETDCQIEGTLNSPVSKPCCRLFYFF